MSNDLAVIPVAHAKECNGCAHFRDRKSIGVVPLDPIWGAGPIYYTRSFYCSRFPKEVWKRRTDSCGEFSAAAAPMTDDTDATREIAEWEAKNGTAEETIARGFKQLEEANERHYRNLAAAYSIGADKKEKEKSLLERLLG